MNILQLTALGVLLIITGIAVGAYRHGVYVGQLQGRAGIIMDKTEVGIKHLG